MDWGGKKGTEPQRPVGKYQRIFVIEVLGEEKKDEAGKVFEEIMAEISSNLTKTLTYIFKNMSDPKQEKPKEIHTKAHHSQTSEN